MVSGTVNTATEVECEGADDAPTATTSSSGSGRDDNQAGDDRGDGGNEAGDDNAAGDDAGEGADNSGPGNQAGDDSGPGDGNDQAGDDNANDDNERNCSAADLKDGVEVREAELRTVDGVLVYEKVELGG